MNELLRPLAWLEPFGDLLKLASFALFVALGCRARRSRTDASHFLGYTLILSSAVGVLQHEAWPFTNWALVHHMASTQVVTWKFEAIDQSGRTWEVDPAIVHPMPPEDFGVWAHQNLRRLPPADKEEIGEDLLTRAEAARLRFRDGEAVSRNGWLFGPFSAPYHFLPGFRWRSPEDVPDVPFAAIQMWLLGWDAIERANGRDTVGQVRLLEWPRPE